MSFLVKNNALGAYFQGNRLMPQLMVCSICPSGFYQEGQFMYCMVHEQLCWLCKGAWASPGAFAKGPHPAPQSVS